MKEKIIKIASTIIIFLMIINYMFPAISYATNQIEEKNESKESVEFDATINSQHELKAQISNILNLEIKVDLNNQGYFKDVTIDSSDGNYEIVNQNPEEINSTINNESESKNKIKDKPIKNINNSIIELNEIQSTEMVDVNIPIKFKDSRELTKENFAKESKIIITGNFVDKNGKESKIKIEKTVKLIWEMNSVGYVKQNITRNIKLGKEKTLLGVEVQEGIIDNTTPIVRKEITIKVPKINNQEPESVKILENNGITYEYKDGLLNISKLVDEKNVTWDSNDTFNIVYLYNTQYEQKELTTSIESKDISITGAVIQSKDENSIFEVPDELGYLADVQTISPDNISKGYMLTNLNRNENKLDTDYKTTYKVSVGYSESIEKIEIKETKNEFLSDENTVVKEADLNIKNKKISVNKEELIDILGNEGTITIKDIENNEIGKIDKDNTSIEIDKEKVLIETSKPVKEGIINIETDKAINTNTDYSKEELKNFKILKTTTEINTYDKDAVISSTNKENITSLENPTSQAEATINQENWSTVVENEDIVLNIMLKTNDIKTALYEDPQINITLPNQVINTTVKTVNKIYDNELEGKNLEVTGNQIKMQLGGTQTQYNNVTTESGALISIAMNVDLESLSPSSDELIKIELVNNSIEDTKEIEIPVKIVAPNEMILTNKLEIDDKSITAMQSEVNNIKIDAYSNSKDMTVSGTIINNLGSDTENIAIVGRLPSEGIKAISGEELSSRVDVTILNSIEIDGLENAAVYYSEDEQETIEGNTWKQELIPNAKSFMIKTQGTFSNKSIARFSYKVSIPENVGYEKVLSEKYGVYYNNGSIDGVNRNLIEAIPVGIETGKAPEVKLEITAKDTNSGYTIEDNGTVKEGEYITLNAKLTNTGSIDAHDVIVNTTLPRDMAFIEYIPSTDSNPLSRYVQQYTTSSKEIVVGDLAAGEEKNVSIQVKNNQVISLQGENEEAKKLTATFNVTSDLVPDGLQKSFTVNNSEGNIVLKLSAGLQDGVTSDSMFNYTIQIENANLAEKGNVDIKVKLPKGIEFVEMNDNYETKYDKKTNELTIYYEGLKALPGAVSFKAKVLDEMDDEVVTVATAKCIGSDEEVKSNEVRFGKEKIQDVIQAEQTTNISNSVLDSDDLEFYIQIKNNSSETRTLKFTDMLPEGLSVKEYKMEIDDEIIEQSNSKYIITHFKLPAGKTAKAKIKVDLYNERKGEVLKIENQPEITMDGAKIDINSVSIDINGTMNTASENITTNQENNNENNNEEKQNSIEESKKITGTAWIDENKNGKVDINEKRISNQNLLLFDSTSNNLVLDGQNNPIQVITDDNGSYTFSNLKPGKYNILSEYDNEKYEPTAYKIDEQEEENSNFTTAIFNEKEILATETIDITNSNAYNVNLGLTYKEIFDLKLEQNISKIIITDKNKGTKEYTYDENNTKRKLEVNPKELSNANAVIEYTIKITNEGSEPGYAKTIVDYLPEEMKFVADMNPGWYKKADGYIYNSTLMNTLIQPGETKELKLVATKQLDEQSLGNTRNTVEIFSTYNEKGLKTINAKAGNRVDYEKDMASTDAIIIKKSEVKVYIVIGLSILLFILIIASVWYIKNKWINNMYQTEKIEGIDD